MARKAAKEKSATAGNATRRPTIDQEARQYARRLVAQDLWRPFRRGPRKDMMLEDASCETGTESLHAYLRQAITNKLLCGRRSARPFFRKPGGCVIFLQRGNAKISVLGIFVGLGHANRAGVRLCREPPSGSSEAASLIGYISISTNEPARAFDALDSGVDEMSGNVSPSII